MGQAGSMSHTSAWNIVQLAPCGGASAPRPNGLVAATEGASPPLGTPPQFQRPSHFTPHFASLYLLKFHPLFKFNLIAYSKDKKAKETDHHAHIRRHSPFQDNKTRPEGYFSPGWVCPDVGVGWI